MIEKINSQKDLEAEIILHAIGISGNIFLDFFDNKINIEEMKDTLRKKVSLSYLDFDSDFIKSISNLLNQGILIEEEPSFMEFLLPKIPISNPFKSMIKIPNELFLNKKSLKERIIYGDAFQIIKEVIIKEENKAKKQIKDKLNELKQKIRDKENEKSLHYFIKENKLIPAPFIKHEFSFISQNRQDFLIKNEFGEYEIWELKSPSVKLFEGTITEDVTEKYKKLKKIFKTQGLVKAIEQLSIYKKEFIDGNTTYPPNNDNLKENIYDAKLILVIGSNEELKSEIYLEKLNLERHMLNNLNIITWEMFYNKIENYYKTLLDD